jgi:bifunctional UDP-N-acetylglucosamine pyrophosphorylase/glucosamine-1-phosphate N-acetyltransferase
VDLGCILTDVIVAANAVIKPYSVCTQAKIGEAAEVGPFSHVRADTEIHEYARIGNFVETKKVIVGRGAMANHLAYLGDGELGERANIGAGTIFCNSDSVNKHRTEVGKGAFVGSGCQLVAPIRIGAGAFVATGTTVTRDVPDDALAIARVPQQNKDGYAKQLRANFAAIKAKLLSKG